MSSTVGSRSRGSARASTPGGACSAAAVARVRNVLVDYRRVADDLGAERTLALATSAVRDAENGEAFLGELEWSYGFQTRLLSGDEEALLTFRGVASGRTIAELHARRRRRRRLDGARSWAGQRASRSTRASTSAASA